MEFKECSIAGLSYSIKPDADHLPTSDHDPDGQYSFIQLDQHLSNSESRAIIHEFLTALMSCHTVIPELNNETGKIIYQASSPDEAALVNGASDIFQYKFVARRPHSIECTKKDVRAEYEVLNVCEFNSTRKRMSVVLRDPDGKIKLYCKGADTVIMERLSGHNPFIQPTLQHLEVGSH
jgi:phospholipid-transporting ATPase